MLIYELASVTFKISSLAILVDSFANRDLQNFNINQPFWLMYKPTQPLKFQHQPTLVQILTKYFCVNKDY